MKWQDLPELHHEEVKLGAELDVFYKSWSNPITLSNNASQEEIEETIRQGMQSYDDEITDAKDFKPMMYREQ